MDLMQPWPHDQFQRIYGKAVRKHNLKLVSIQKTYCWPMVRAGVQFYSIEITFPHKDKSTGGNKTSDFPENINKKGGRRSDSC